MKTLLKAIILSSVLCSTAYAGPVVIVGAKSPVRDLTKEQVSNLFLGKESKFPDGSMAVPIEQAEGSPVKDDFHSKVTSRSPAQLKSYWSKLVFSGKGSPPKEVPGSADVKKLVTANPNMIGYVDSTTVDSSVKAVFTP
jgi:ABC-type phosphate transport system substrate-binding protein